MAILTKKADVAKAQKFTGIIVESVSVATDFGKDRWLWSIYNLDRAEFNTVGVNEADPSNARTYKDSGINKRLLACQKLNIDLDIHEYAGLKLDFTVDYTQYNNGMVSTNVLPVKSHGRIPTEELTQLQESLAKTREESKQRREQSAVPAVATHADFSQSDVDTLLAIYNGKTDDEAQTTAMRSDLSVDLKNSISNSTAVEYLMGLGLLDIDDDGRYVATPVAVGAGA